MGETLKDRLIAAALMIDRSGERMKMTVLQGGVRVYISGHMDGRKQTLTSYVGWTNLEHAVQNPLTLAVRDLINQKKELEERET